MSVGRDDYDSPWKEAIETFFRDCLAFFMPQAHAEIDWSKPYAFLDQELRQVQREAELGRQVVDKLVQVSLLQGTDAWVLVHLEVQSQPETDFEKRMFTYSYRLFDRFDRPVASLAILGDERPNWRPHSYKNELWGSGIQFTFNVVKLLDYRANLQPLDVDPNPFAAIVLAHLRTQETRHDPTARFAAKLAVLRRLYARGYNREQILGLYRFIDWIMALPTDLERRFLATLREIEEENRMPYVTSAERFGREIGREEGIKEGIKEGRESGLREGLREGLIEGIELALLLKFGPAGQALIPEIRQLADLAVIRQVHAAIAQARTIDEVRQVYA